MADVSDTDDLLADSRTTENVLMSCTTVSRVTAQ